MTISIVYFAPGTRVVFDENRSPLELQPMAWTSGGRTIGCDFGAIRTRGSRTTLFVAGEREALDEAELRELVEKHAEMSAWHEAGHFVAMRLHGARITCVSFVPDGDRAAYVEAKGRGGVGTLAFLVESWAGERAARVHFGWRSDAGAEDDHERASAALVEYEAEHDSAATDLLIERAETRLDEIMDAHAEDIRRAARAFASWTGRNVDGAELERLASTITPRWSAGDPDERSESGDESGDASAALDGDASDLP